MTGRDEAQLDALLDREPRNIAALVEKGDCRARAGDDRAATAFYRSALAAAGAQGLMPTSLRPAIERAQSGIARAEQGFRRHFEQSLADAGFGEGSRPPRFAHAVDLLLGRAEARLELQRPTSFYYPGLPQRRYFDPSEFAWATSVEAAAGAIRAEFEAAARGDNAGFAPYLVNDPSRPRTEFHGLRDNPDWSTLQLMEKGAVASQAGDRFPATLAAIQKADLARISVRAPSILFSKLSPGARIPPHHGMLNVRLVCHLPLIVPPGCGFRVGGEERRWEEGKLLIFDDTIEHEAWNDSGQDRVILIFDVWRAELDARERRAITTIFEAIDAA